MEKILVADDEREIAELLEACLSAGGYEVFKCYSAADVRKAPLSEVSLAILDIMLPDGDGFPYAGNCGNGTSSRSSC